MNLVSYPLSMNIPWCPATEVDSDDGCSLLGEKLSYFTESCECELKILSASQICEIQMPLSSSEGDFRKVKSFMLIKSFRALREKKSAWIFYSVFISVCQHSLWTPFLVIHNMVRKYVKNGCLIALYRTTGKLFLVFGIKDKNVPGNIPWF